MTSKIIYSVNRFIIIQFYTATKWHAIVNKKFT